MCVPAAYSLIAENAAPLPTRPSLLLRLRDASDVQAWRSFVEVYAPLVYRRCCRRGLSHQDAEDVSQEVFAQIARSIRDFTYRPEVGRFRDWLGVVVENKVNRHLGKTQATAAGGDEHPALKTCTARGEDTAWAEEFEAHVLRVALERCRPHFSDETWRGFELVWLEHRPAAEAAHELGQTIDWVYVAKSRVLKRLWEEVQ